MMLNIDRAKIDHKPGHESETITVVKCLRDILTKGVSSPSGRDAPAAPVIWVRPEQVTHGALVRHLLQPVQGPDVVQRVDAGGEAAVQTEDLAVHQRCERQVVKQVSEIFPHVGISILPQAFVIKPIHLEYIRNEKNVICINSLKCEQSFSRL